MKFFTPIYFLRNQKKFLRNPRTQEILWWVKQLTRLISMTGFTLRIQMLFFLINKLPGFLGS